MMLARVCTYKQGSHASWKVLDFFLENSRTWKVLEKHFSPGKFWKFSPVKEWEPCIELFGCKMSEMIELDAFLLESA